MKRPFWPSVVALSGLAPYLCIAAVLPFVSAPLANQLVSILIAYAAAVLSFLGGVRWGAELTRAPDDPSAFRLAAAAIPSCVSWVVILLMDDAAVAVVVLWIAGAAHLVWDIAAARAGLLPRWNSGLRVVLTLVASLCMLVVFVCLMRA
jgi:hypothetical protein